MNNQFKTLILVSVITQLFACMSPKPIPSDDPPIFPQEAFSAIETTLMDGRPAIGTFNHGYKNYRYKAKFPWCLSVSIGLDQSRMFDNGLPQEDEIQVAYRMEVELGQKVA